MLLNIEVGEGSAQMAEGKKSLDWELRTSGSLEDIGRFTSRFGTYERLEDLPEPYDLTDVSPFSPSTAIYFMDGFSDATVRLRDGTELSFAFQDSNTSISASAPVLYGEKELEDGVYTAVPPPLEPQAFYPLNTPETYREATTLHLLQVVSMNMRSLDGQSSLLIGLPYAERYPDLFFSTDVLESGDKGAASYGVVQSLTRFERDQRTDNPTDANGYPARSFFGIYHVIETSVGAFFNKKATQMELLPNRQGKLATKLPPIPFIYKLLNGPIPLYDVKDPIGEAIGEVIQARHGSHKEAEEAIHDDWPNRQVMVTNPRQR